MAKTESAAMQLRRNLLQKEQELLGTENPVYKTNGVFRPYHNSQRYEVDIRAATAKDVLNSYKYLLNHVQAANELGVDPTHLGFTVEEWKDDMKLRIGVINRSTTLNKIIELKTKLRSVLTPKELREIGIEDLAAEVENI